MKTGRLLSLLFPGLLIGALPLAIATSAAAFQTQPAGTVNVAVANVRSGPGTNYPVVTQARLGDVVTLLATNPRRDWYQTCCINQVTGWIWANLLTVEGSTDSLPVVSEPLPRPTATPPAQGFSVWRGEYYGNRSLQGQPAVVRDDAEINFRWSGASPATGVPGLDFSARWTRTLTLAAGNYTFYAIVDDGVRLWLDGTLLIDDWREGSQRTLVSSFQNLGAGRHTVKVEYFQARGDSLAIVWWEEPGQFPEWKAEYFDDIYLQPTSLLVRNDSALDFNWGLGSPAPAVPADNFSVRWTRRMRFSAGDYAFFARTSDGVRVYLDGWLVIDEWRDTEGYPTYTGLFRGLGEGQHIVVVEYYERGGIAYAQVWWQDISAGGGDLP